MARSAQLRPGNPRMSKYELIKSIEGQKLNPRTGIPTTDPPVSIPFGGIIQDVTPDRDVDKFIYLGLPYQCPHDILASAITPIDGPEKTAPAPAAEPAVAPPAAVAAAAPAAAAAAPQEAPERALVWEPLNSTQPCCRAKIPGGWLISAGGALAWYPDPEHAWDGASLP